MKSIRHLISGLLASLLLVSLACASVYIEPSQPGDFRHINNYGLFFGVNDDTGQDYKGAEVALAIADKFSYYGYNVTDVGKSGKNGNMDMTTLQIMNGIIGASRPDTFYNLENVVFYLTGHGLKPSNNEPNMIFTASNGVNTNYGITDIELTRYLSYVPPSYNKIVILDSCYSGGFIDELKSLKNISIVTAASSSSGSAYNSDGVSFFSKELSEFLDQQNGKRFSFDYMVAYLADNYNYKKYKGMMAYDNGAGDPVTLSEEYFNIQTYQSPEYASAPEPTTMLLLGLGLIGLAGIRKKMGL